MHEVEEHRRDVLHADDVGSIEVVLQRQGGHRTREQRALEPGKVVGREAGLSGVAAHRLVGEEQEQEWSPVDDEGACAA